MVPLVSLMGFVILEWVVKSTAVMHLRISVSDVEHYSLVGV